ncbi:hypothetical protein MANES_09G012402v8 [Manihot esculenta]|uniref:Uncharacterized protein n=1 Tax=Manihot esculenta TaxID=3983 RepID=A0ACB7H3H7_MANES|nr:hypothetical protein MANES_09G012402v8 [Manihot esculenta]
MVMVINMISSGALLFINTNNYIVKFIIYFY